MNNTNKKHYNNLHQHSVYSTLDSNGFIKSIVSRAKDLNFDGVCITDHGNLASWYELTTECRKQGIKPIYASEPYFVPYSRFIKEKVEGYRSYYHIILIAKNEIGFKNLIEMSNRAWIDGFYYKMRIDYELLEQYHEGVICLSACLGGLDKQLILEGRYDEAKEHLLRHKQIFGSDYYIELQDTLVSEQKIVNEILLQYSKELEIPVVVTCDSHYTTKDESFFHNVLVLVNTRGKLKEQNNKLSDEDDKYSSNLIYTPEEYYIKDLESLKERFPEVPQAFENTVNIARECNVTWNIDKEYIPEPKTESKDFDRILFEECTKKLKDLPEEYTDRFNLEYDVISKMGYSSYFLFVADYIKVAKEKGICVGPGRGCLHPNTKIFTQKGFVSIKNINPKEHFVLDKNGVYRKILNVQRYILDKNEKLLHIKTDSDVKGISLTPDHKVLKIVDEKLVWTEAKDLKVNNYLYYPLIKKSFVSFTSDYKDIDVDFCKILGKKIFRQNALDLDENLNFSEVPKELLDLLFEGIDKKKEYSIVTMRNMTEKLAYKILEFCSFINTDITLFFKEGNYYNINFAKPKNLETAHYKTLTIKEINLVNTENNPDYVYDLQIERAGQQSYLTESGIVHNSAAGSLISYLLGITKIDPLEYGLLFERFLSPGRAKVPLIEFPEYKIKDV